MTRRDYYEILGIGNNVSTDEVEKAFRQSLTCTSEPAIIAVCHPALAYSSRGFLLTEGAELATIIRTTPRVGLRASAGLSFFRGSVQ